MQSTNESFHNNNDAGRTETHSLGYDDGIGDVYVDRVNQRYKEAKDTQKGYTPSAILPDDLPFGGVPGRWPSANQTYTQSREINRSPETHFVYHVDGS